MAFFLSLRMFPSRNLPGFESLPQTGIPSMWRGDLRISPGARMKKAGSATAVTPNSKLARRGPGRLLVSLPDLLTSPTRGQVFYLSKNEAAAVWHKASTFISSFAPNTRKPHATYTNSDSVDDVQEHGKGCMTSYRLNSHTSQSGPPTLAVSYDYFKG